MGPDAHLFSIFHLMARRRLPWTWSASLRSSGTRVSGPVSGRHCTHMSGAYLLPVSWVGGVDQSAFATNDVPHTLPPWNPYFKTLRWDFHPQIEKQGTEKNKEATGQGARAKRLSANPRSPSGGRAVVIVGTEGAAPWSVPHSAKCGPAMDPNPV